MKFENLNWIKYIVSYALLNRAFLFTKKKLQCLTLAENTKTTVVFQSEDAVLYEKKSMYIVWHYTLIHLAYFCNFWNIRRDRSDPRVVTGGHDFYIQEPSPLRKRRKHSWFLSFFLSFLNASKPKIHPTDLPELRYSMILWLHNLKSLEGIVAWYPCCECAYEKYISKNLQRFHIPVLW